MGAAGGGRDAATTGRAVKRPQTDARSAGRTLSVRGGCAPQGPTAPRAQLSPAAVSGSAPSLSRARDPPLRVPREQLLTSLLRAGTLFLTVTKKREQK